MAKMANKVVIKCLLWAMCLVTAMPSHAQTHDVPVDADWQEVKQTLQHLHQTHNIPVLAATVVEAGKPARRVIIGGNEQTPMRWGSITKTITALTVLSLFADDTIELDTPLAQYIDSSLWQNPWRDTHPVTVQHLLELRAGLPDLSKQEFDFNQPISLKDALAFNPKHRTALWPPGLQHGYSNLTLGLTQQLIETISGTPYAEAIKARVFKPLGMLSAGISPQEDLPGGFKADGITPIPYWHMTFPAYGALNANIADMQKLLLALMGNGRIPPTTLNYLYKAHGRTYAPDFTFDYAAGLYPRIRQGHIWHTHGGDADGYRSRMALLKAAQRGYVININLDDPGVLRRIERVLERYLTRDLTPNGATPNHTLRSNPAELTLWVGDYYPSTVRFGIRAWQTGQLPTIQVRIEQNRLVVYKQGRRYPLTHFGAGQFARSGEQPDPAPTLVFFQDQADPGKPIYLQGALGEYVHLSTCPAFLSFPPGCND